MKKQLFLLLFIALFASSFFAQNRSACEEQIDSVRFRVVEKGGHLAIEWGSGGADFRRVSHSNLTFEKVALVDADLVFWFAPRAVGDGLLADFSIQILEQKSRRDLSPRADRWADFAAGAEAGLGLSAYDEKVLSRFRRRAFLDATEKGLISGSEYVLFLKSSLRTTIDCARRPTFSIQKQLPNYAVGLVGAAFLANVSIQKSRAAEQYDLYKKAWRDGETRAAGDPFLKEADQKATAARASAAVGATILAADALWFFVRFRKFERLKKQFCRCCGDCEKGQKMSLRDLRPSFDSVGGAGFSARFEF